MKCKCGNNEFYAKQTVFVDTDGDSRELVSLDVIVSEDNVWVSNVDEDYEGISDANNPEGPYACTKCGELFKSITA